MPHPSGGQVLLQLLQRLNTQRARCQHTNAQIAVQPTNWAKYLSHLGQDNPSTLPSTGLGQAGHRPFYEALMQEVQLALTKEGSRQAIDQRPSRVSLRQQLQSLGVAERDAHLMAHLEKTAQKVLGLRANQKINPQQGLMNLGMDSLMAIEFRNHLTRSLEQSLPATLLFDYPTIEELANYLEKEILLTDSEDMTQLLSHGSSRATTTLVPIQPHGSKPPLFFVSSILGMTFELQQLSNALGPEQPFYGLRSLGLEKNEQLLTHLADIASYHIQALQSIQPQGPYLIGGYSFGGQVAFEMAQQLQQQGYEVSMLYILDIHALTYRHKQEQDMASWDETKFLSTFAKIHANLIQQDLDISLQSLHSLAPDKRFAHVVEQLNTSGVPWSLDDFHRMFDVFKANMLSTMNYRPQMNEHIPTLVLRASEVGILDILPNESETEADPSWGWHDLVGDSLEIKFVQGNHFTMLSHPNVQSLANTLNESL